MGKLSSRKKELLKATLSISMYGLALLQLMDLVNEKRVFRKWYADDGNVAGSIESLRNLFEKLKLHGLAFAYNITKCHIITNDYSLEKSKDFFKDEDVELVGGHRIQGSVIASSDACHAFQSSKLPEYANIVYKLASHEKDTTECLSCIYKKRLTQTHIPVKINT